MSLDEKKLKALQADADSWLDATFGSLDMSAYPDFKKPQKEESFIDERFGQRLDTTTSDQAAALKRFVNNPDDETVRRVISETGDADLQQRLTDDREASEAVAFTSSTPEYFPSDRNYRALRRYLDRHGLDFTAANLSLAYGQLTREGRLELRPGTPRPLSEHDRREIAIHAATDALGAMQTFLQRSLPQDVVDQISNADTFDDAMRILADPIFAPIVAEAVWFAFEASRTDFSSTPARKKFMTEYCGNRPLTLELLSAAWKSCQEHERSASRSSLFDSMKEPQSDTSEAAADFDGLNDEAVADLTRRTLAEARRKLGPRTGIIQ